jgi:alcohol dehydrogenase class IV
MFGQQVLDFLFPPRVLFGIGAISRVGSLAGELSSGRSALILTDKILVGMGFMKEIRGHLEGAGFQIQVFDEVETEPREETVLRVAEHVRGVRPDVIIGVGGGSVLDMSKTASVMATNPGDPLEYFGAPLMPAKRSPERRGIPKVLIPTTAGTASEVTQFAVIIDRDRRTKKALSSPHAMADLALVDPSLTASMPPRLTAGCGMDALSHAIEGYMSLWSSPLTDAVSLEASRLIFQNLRRAYYNGGDMNARYNMSLAASMSGIPLANAKVVLGHSIAQVIGPRYGIPHGIACGMALPYAMRYNLPVLIDKFCKLAWYIGIEPSGSEKRLAEIMVEEVSNLARDIKIPLSLNQLGIDKEDLSDIAEDIIRYQPRPNNPRILVKEDLRELLLDMWNGKIF